MYKIDVVLPLSAQIANIIRQSIISGEIKPGQKISVSKITDHLDVSATPVKEAFKILQAEGLLQTKARSGTYVSDFAISSMHNMAYIRSALEGVAVNIATKIASDAQLNELIDILDGGDVAIQNNDMEKLVATNTSFHRKIREISGNQYLYMLIEQLVSFDLSVRERALRDMESRIKGGKEHRNIVKLMIARKAEEAEQAMIHHIRNTVSDAVSNRV